MVQKRRFMDDFYFLEDERVRQFLIVGKDEALLIDTGFEDSHVYDVVRSITELPVRVLMTHGDRDHAGGLKDFGACQIHKGDWNLIPEGILVEPLKEGDTFRCGQYTLEVIEIPGHTYGSVAFVERKKKLLLPGDSVQKDGPIYMFGEHRNLDLYIESLKKLQSLADKVETVLPCHHDCPITPDYIGKNLQDAEALKNGMLSGKKHPHLPCASYHGRWTEFYYTDYVSE